MRKTEAEEAWAVYEVVQGKQAGIKVMCRQSQWEALAVKHPEANALVQGNIASENEAERIARGTSGDAKSRKVITRKPASNDQSVPAAAVQPDSPVTL